MEEKNSTSTFFERLIESSQKIVAYKQGKKELMDCRYQIPIKDMAYALAFGLQKGLDGLPMVVTAGIIGKKALIEWEDEHALDENMEVINTRRFFLGYHLLLALAYGNQLEFIQNNYPNAPLNVLPFSSREDYIERDALITELRKRVKNKEDKGTLVEDIEAIEAVMKEKRTSNEPILRGYIEDQRLSVRNKAEAPTTEIPEPYTGFKHKLAGELIHNASDITKINVDIECLGKPGYLDVVNKQQEVPMRVNKDTVGIIEQCREDKIFTQKHKRMKKKARESVMASYERAITDAKKLSNKDFYEFYHYDYRGRLYSTSSNLNYGGHKLAKSLFYFSEKKPLGPDGWNELLIHAANCWGEDKLSVEARIQYTEDRLDEWMIWAEEPMKFKGKMVGSKWRRLGWQSADSPWEFISVIREIWRAIDSGDEYAYESGHPTAIDCSCSGLQVLAFLSRCDVSAPLCNLIKSNERGDYYLSIADVIFSKDRKYSAENIKKLDDIIEEVDGLSSGKMKEFMCVKGNGKRLSAVSEQFWDRLYSKRRSLVKRSCMTYLYSCGVEEMAKHILEDHETDKEIKGLNSVFAYCLAFKIVRAAEAVLPGPVSVMDTLMSVAISEHDKNRDFGFRGVYNNFPFLQEYRVDITRQFKCPYYDKFFQPRVKVDEVRTDFESIQQLTDTRDKKMEAAINAYNKIKNPTAEDLANTTKHTKNIKKCFGKLIKKKDSVTDAACGSSPNFVHKLDSQVLSKTIMDCDFNIKTVHDSVAAVPSDMPKLRENYKNAFKILFDEKILEKMLRQKGYMDLYDGIVFGEMNEFTMNEHSIS